MLKGEWNPSITYETGDVVRFENGVFYHLQRPCRSGVPPTDTLYWGRLEQNIAQCAAFVMDALAMEQVNNAGIASNLSETALVLRSSEEGSQKEFLITVDDSGDLTATEIVEEGGAE